MAQHIYIKNRRLSVVIFLLSVALLVWYWRAPDADEGYTGKDGKTRPLSDREYVHEAVKYHLSQEHEVPVKRTALDLDQIDDTLDFEDEIVERDVFKEVQEDPFLLKRGPIFHRNNLLPDIKDPNPDLVNSNYSPKVVGNVLKPDVEHSMQFKVAKRYGGNIAVLPSVQINKLHQQDLIIHHYEDSRVNPDDIKATVNGNRALGEGPVSAVDHSNADDLGIISVGRNQSLVDKAMYNMMNRDTNISERGSNIDNISNVELVVNSNNANDLIPHGPQNLSPSDQVVLDRDRTERVYPPEAHFNSGDSAVGQMSNSFNDQNLPPPDHHVVSHNRMNQPIQNTYASNIRQNIPQEHQVIFDNVQNVPHPQVAVMPNLIKNQQISNGYILNDRREFHEEQPMDFAQVMTPKVVPQYNSPERDPVAVQSVLRAETANVLIPVKAEPVYQGQLRETV